jgi:D-alanyl-D-alanine carboxypeptidase (penicillin-binding protein 5/6)
LFFKEHYSKAILRDKLASMTTIQTGVPEELAMKYFVGEMNKVGKLMGMHGSKFSNPHGLSSKSNYSTAADIGKAACIALRDPLFRKIVSMKDHGANAITKNGKSERFQWYNTNKILNGSFKGVKTGITTTAGPSLCCYFVHP